jgi:tetratricopeptide (TPR) repeat protein
MQHDGDNMGRCAYCQQTLFGDADRLFTLGQDDNLHPDQRLAAYRQCIVAAEDYPTGPYGENRLASAAHHNIGEIYIREFPELEEVNGFPDLERARQHYQLSIEYNPGNHEGLTMIGQCVHGLRRDDADQEAIASARGWWGRALAMNPDDHIAIKQMALTHDVM